MRDSRPTPLVLVVDDDLAMRMLAAEALTSNGFAVEECQSGEEALAVYETLAPDAVLLDVVMGGIDGNEVCRRLRQLKGGSTVPILMMTGRDDVASISAAYHAGATDFITKPVPYALLPHRLRYLLRAASAFREAHDSAARLARAQRLARLSQWEFELQDGTLRWSHEATEIFGIPLEHSEGGAAALLQWVHPEDRAMVTAMFDPPHAHQIDYRMRLPDGRERAIHQEAEIVLELDSSEPRLVGAVQDMTEWRQAEQRAIALAYYDSLTGLPNRAELRRYLSQALEQAERLGQTVSLFALDLGKLRRVNDLHGEARGDAILIEVAARLQRTMRSCQPQMPKASQAPGWGMLARPGGDEFMLVIPCVQSAEQAASIARSLIEEVSAKYVFDGVELFLTASIGIAMFPEAGRTADEFFEHADAAMYHAKELGPNNFRFFDMALQQRAKRQMEIESGLKAALDSARRARESGSGNPPDLDLHFQPKVALPALRTSGVEGLLRWRSPKLGQVSPYEFIQVAESSDLIVELGEWVLWTACTAGVTWLGDLTIAVNISPRQFRHPGFVKLVADVLRETGLQASRLELEITEGVVMQDTETGQQVLKELKELGVSIVLDDFGTGYSSLSYLMRFPIDILKIDRSFVINLPSKMYESVIAAIFTLARSLGVSVVVEGVETRAQLEHFEQYGAVEIQGYYFSRPQCAADLRCWLEESPHGIGPAPIARPA
ncbi:MAG TPA: EAL domain-containing protein [Polyangiales bacterium]|nr:EAL domain-containing protein [Polyangiales bacterium]